MGCQSSTAGLPPPPPVDEPRKVDARLPFASYRQLFSLKNYWKQVVRTLEDTAKDNLVRLFKAHPEYRDLYPSLKNLKTETQMLNSLAFETASSDMFNNLDEVMNHLETVDNAVSLLHQIGEMHKSNGFPVEFFQHMEDSFLASIKKTLDDRYTETCDESFRKLYSFIYTHISEGYKAE